MGVHQKMNKKLCFLESFSRSYHTIEPPHIEQLKRKRKSNRKEPNTVSFLELKTTLINKISGNIFF